MRIALDTNILVYAAHLVKGPDDQLKVREVETLLTVLARTCRIIVPTQVFGELYNVATRNAVAREQIRSTIVQIQTKFDTIAASAAAFGAALDLATDHQLQIWDSLILSTAAEADCAILLSEDMQNGFVWRGVTVINPFAAKRHPLLESLLA